MNEDSCHDEPLSNEFPNPTYNSCYNLAYVGQSTAVTIKHVICKVLKISIGATQKEGYAYREQLNFLSRCGEPENLKNTRLTTY